MDLKDTTARLRELAHAIMEHSVGGEALIALCDAADERDALRARAETAERALAESAAHVEALRGALAFYADPDTYEQVDLLGLSPLSDDCGGPGAGDERDFGKRARAALSLTPPAALAEVEARVLERVAQEAEDSISGNPGLIHLAGEAGVHHHYILRMIARDLRAEATRLRAEGGGNDE